MTISNAVKNRKKCTILVLGLIVFLLASYSLAVETPLSVGAISAESFNAGRIIDDSVFYNPNTMTVAEIQKLLDEKSPACDMWGTGLISGRKYPDGTWVPAGTHSNSIFR